MHIHDVFLLNLSGSLAVSINSLLILLIVFKSPKALGTYKYLMIYIAFFELTYAILYMAEKIDLFTKNSAFLLIVNWKTSVFPKIITCGVNLLFTGFFGISLAILDLHFIYRFLSMTNNPLLKSFESPKMVLWFLIPLLNGVMFMIAGGIILNADEESDWFIRENYPPLLNNSTDMDSLYYVGPFFWPKKAESEELHFSWKGAAGSLFIMGMVFLSSGIMLFFGIKGYQSMKELISQQSCSVKFKSVQSQLFHALLFQTAIPVFLMHIPATAIYSTIFLNSAPAIVGEALSLSIAMYPALNPLPTIFIVKSYRKAIKEFLISGKARITPSFGSSTNQHSAENYS